MLKICCCRWSFSRGCTAGFIPVWPHPRCSSFRTSWCAMIENACRQRLAQHYQPESMVCSLSPEIVLHDDLYLVKGSRICELRVVFSRTCVCERAVMVGLGSLATFDATRSRHLVLLAWKMSRLKVVLPSTVDRAEVAQARTCTHCALGRSFASSGHR